MLPSAPDAVFLADPATFLRQRRKHTTAIRTADDLDSKELTNPLPRLFDDLADRLWGTPASEQEKHAQQHGEHRRCQDCSLVEMLRELGCRLLSGARSRP